MSSGKVFIGKVSSCKCSFNYGFLGKGKFNASWTQIEPHRDNQDLLLLQHDLKVYLRDQQTWFKILQRLCPSNRHPCPKILFLYFGIWALLNAAKTLVTMSFPFELENLKHNIRFLDWFSPKTNRNNSKKQFNPPIPETRLYPTCISLSV